MTAVHTATDAGRAFWHETLAAGGSTTIPRWSQAPAPGTAALEVTVADSTRVTLRRLADRLAVPLGSVLLAAHARVLSALSGEHEVVTGYVAGDGNRPLPCRISTDAGSWRALVRRTAAVEAQVLAHRHAPLEELQRELDTRGPSFETVFDPTGAGGDLPDGIVLEVAPAHHGDRLAVRLRYRTDVLDADAAARIAGYHHTALEQLAVDPDAEPRQASLVSPEELRFQLEDLGGPQRALPDRPVHELIEERAAAQPDAVAVVCGDRQWTYAELNARANHLARALLARGVRREDVVAVVMERDLEWVAAVLAVYKSGGAYLPLEPHFPAGRIGTALTRAECRLVLTEERSSTTLDQALETLPDVERLPVDAAWAEDHADGDLGVPVAPDQLAYMLFTSGSTGEPKGVMCEHAGLINHLFAKIEDLAIAEGEVVPQTGPQCFDISIWQMVAGLVLGGRTLVVPQDVILDVERFVDTIVDNRAAVLQVVPSYLDVIVSYLEQHPRELPDLHTVCPTGDFLKKELVQRWFAVQPGIPVVNTYGLTETSDDAVHEIMAEVPAEERVPLGRPIINTHVDVVDEHGTPVPLGAPGLIVFSGICVGRGYVNDPERTARVFRDDPNRPGERICWTGDYGRWLPNGKLDFLGRRDNQVKIRGFRIEIGEVENGLLRVPGVRDGAAVVAEGADRNKRLVAFYSGPGPIEDDVLRERLGAAVPEYMVPSTFHWREVMPLTANGKIDRTTLTALAGELLSGTRDLDAPETPTERRLAEVWSTVLGVPAEQIGRRDSFATLGGTSLSAVKLVVALGRAVSLKELQAVPDLAALAALLDERTGSSPIPSPRAPERTS
ncbi:non-ribosomal peptide synthetase [Geodermatophilus sp. URMC 61]|uniref:non-ribosomal peptide synthetase n=1 Tax=Geodermatophilus sp. URMC 61 TaxID=3423411 RepID=UPI00406C34FE